jgi:branched-chain amino acid transport system substrate-binding protein
MGIFLGSALIQTLPSISNQQTIHITTASADPRAGKLVSKSNDDITGEGGETEYERFKYHFRAGPLHLLDLADAMLEFIENKKEDYGWERVALMTENVGEFDPYHDRLSNRLSDVIDVPVKSGSAASATGRPSSTR